MYQRLLKGYEQTLIAYFSDILKIVAVPIFGDTAIYALFFQTWVNFGGT